MPVVKYKISWVIMIIVMYNVFKAPQDRITHTLFPSDYALLCIREHSRCTCIKRVFSSPRETCCACERLILSRTLSSLLPALVYSSLSSMCSFPLVSLQEGRFLTSCRPGLSLLFLLMEFIMITKKAPVTHCWVDCIVRSHVRLIWLIAALETELEKNCNRFYSNAFTMKV